MPLCPRRSLFSLLCLLLLVMSACSSYKLQGRVVRGTGSYIQVVDADDPRLEGAGIAGAQVTVTLDPQRLKRKVIGSTTTDGNGNFSIAIDEPGAGFLEYDIGIKASGQGLIHALSFMELPSSRRRVLVTLQVGRDVSSFEDTLMQDEDLWEEAERYR